MRFKINFFFAGLFTGFLYLRYNAKTEFQTLKYPNMFIPKFIYDAREDHHKYWELSRIARNKTNQFSYYFYDPQTDFVYYIN